MKYLSGDVEDTDNQGENITAGSFEGYVVSKKEENWKIYLQNEILNEKVVDFLIKTIEASNIDEIAVLRNINVDDEFRGCGNGDLLMGDFLDAATSDNNAQLVLLCADLQESQQEGFKLLKWYSNYEFEKVYANNDIMLMAWDVNNSLEHNGQNLEKQLEAHMASKSKFRPG